MLKTKHPRLTLSLLSASVAMLVAWTIGTGCSSDKKSTNGGDDPRFDPDIVEIVLGDTIRWTAVSGDHTVTSGTGSSDPNVGQMFDQTIDEGESFSYVFISQGMVDYFCRPHESNGMNGSVTVKPVANKTVNVSASGSTLTFSPANITINVGDTVRWNSTGSHTVTSGTGSGAADAGDLFDETINNGEVFTYVFDDAGVFPYFCRPHEFTGMKGTVTVNAFVSKTVDVDATL